MVTILILGLDYADWEGTDRLGPPRSDAMMLLTVDPVKRTDGMLSIPRDLWVEIPNILGMHKINTAHRFGEIYRLPGGGPGLAIRTVEQLLGVPVNYYATIDFYAFEALIDELGGIELDVSAAIEIDPICPGGKVVLEPGRQHLDGALALAYARNRYTPGDDFDRSRRQQQVILAVRDRVLRLDMLPHVVDVEQACRRPRRLVLLQRPGLVLDGHLPASKRHHSPAMCHVPFVQFGALQVICHHRRSF